jgi:FkbM family methyltransferase
MRIPQPAIGQAEKVSSEIGSLWFRADDNVMRPAVRRTGLWEPGETSVLRQLVRPSCRILDVGAHIGYFSLVAHQVATGVVIDAIEPDPFTARLCELNLFAAGADARVWTCGLGDRRDSLSYTTAENNPGDGRVHTSGDFATTVVPIIPADELFPDQIFDIVKIDVQGFEQEVLRGMQLLLRRSPGVKILIEFFPSAIVDAGGKPSDVLSEYKEMGFKVLTLVSDQIHELSDDEILTICSNAGPEGFVTLLLLWDRIFSKGAPGIDGQ